MNRYLGQDKSATLWREWFGLTNAFVWFFGSMYSYYEPLFEGTATELLFMLLLCAGLTGSAFLLGKHPIAARRVLPAATLAGAVCTGLIPFLPVYAAKGLFWFSALLMTPLLCRRLYGVLRCAKDTSRIRVYISTVSVTIVLQMVWTLLPISYSVKFPMLSAFAILGLYRAGTSLPEPDVLPLPRPAMARSTMRLLRIAAVFVLLVGLNVFNTLVHSHVLSGSLDRSDLLSLFAWTVVPLAFLFFAVLSDKGKERLGFAVALAFILLGCFAALTQNNSVFAAPLLLFGEFGGTITEFFFLTMPLMFFRSSRRPVLIAVSGLISHTLLASAVSWTQDLWLPQSFLSAEIDRPLIIFGAACAMLLIPLLLSVWKQQEDASLMGALLGLKKQAEETAADIDTHSASSSETPPKNANQNWMQAIDLLVDEHRIATLLCDGLTRAEISQQTGLSASQVAAHLRNIRAKLEAKPPVGQSAYVREAARRYGLTTRETEVFGEIISGRSNAEIAANLYIEVATVKTHVNKILKKTGVASRAEMIAVARQEEASVLSG
jgi:DNA-binding CsgD family transcriptional regulator